MPAKRRLGQNFLTGSHYPQRIVSSLGIQSDETILEIGPGQGALTSLLLEAGARVIAIELDRDLIPHLNARFADNPQFQVIEADALTVDFCSLIRPGETARVAANLPYNVATPILQRLIESRSCLTEMTLMFQREVVDRICAPSGGKEYGYLSILAQLHCDIRRLFEVPPGAFRPVPKVMSSVVQLRVRSSPVVPVRDEAFFLRLTGALFAQRRKTIFNNLRAAQSLFGLNQEGLISALEQAGLDSQRRAETLTINEIARLAEALLISAVR